MQKENFMTNRPKYVSKSKIVKQGKSLMMLLLKWMTYFFYRLVSWVVSNCEKAPSKRMEYVQSLQKYVGIDIYGKIKLLLKVS